jgi:membrane fusion protein (multidrug efflux system)
MSTVARSDEETETVRTPRGGVTNNRPPGRKRLGVVVAAVVVLAALVFGVHRWWWGRSHEGTDDAQVDGHIIPVLSKVGGYVATVRVIENSRVRAGDTLATLDQRDLRAALDKAEAELAAAVAASGSAGRVGQSAAQVSSVRASAEAARAAVDQAEANAAKADRDVERLSGLAQRNIISRQQLDAAETAARAAHAQVIAATETSHATDQQVIAAEAGLRGADARVSVARANRDQAALQLSYTVITAPSSGVVSRKSIEVGQLVQPGQPVMTVVPLDDIWVVANLKETQVRGIRVGDAADIEVDAYPGRDFPGRVESISPATGAKFSLLPPDNATGNFTKVVQRVPVRVRLAQSQDSSAELRPGMSATVTITTR